MNRTMRYTVLLFFSILFLLIKPCDAIFEGTANADIFIRIYEQHGDYGRLALWHETAAECLNLISVPMNKITHNYYKSNVYEKWTERTEKEALEIREQRQFHLEQAKAAWKKSKTSEKVLNAERKKIVKFMKTWLPHYPDRFYTFGIYVTFFKEQQERAELIKDYSKVLKLEADAAEMCAALYDKIPIANELEDYVEQRDAYLRHATLLRTLAKPTLKKLPTDLRIGKKIKVQKPSTQNITQNTKKTILNIAKNSNRIKNLISDHKVVREYAWFQGFAWTVSYYNHGWGNLVIAVVDDKTGKIIDILEGEKQD